MSIQIFIGADHRGADLKNKLLPILTGTHEYVEIVDKSPNNQPEDDYNDSAQEVAKSVASTPDSYGILICGSAHGMTIQANRFKGIRAINVTIPELAKLGREHNNANVLCLPADFLTVDQANEIIHTFFHTKYLDEPRLERRNQKLDKGI